MIDPLSAADAAWSASTASIKSETGEQEGKEPSAETSSKPSGHDGNNAPRSSASSNAPATIIDPAAPFTTAKTFRELRFNSGGHSILHFHKGAFYLWNGCAYVELDENELRAEIYTFLDGCVWQAPPPLNIQLPVKPTKTRVTAAAKKSAGKAFFPAQTPWVDLRRTATARSWVRAQFDSVN